MKLTISDVVAAPDECHKRDRREIAFLCFWVFFRLERLRQRLMTPLTPKHWDIGRTLSATRRDT